MPNAKGAYEAVLSSYLDILNLTNGWWNGYAIFTHTVDMKDDRLTNLDFGLFSSFPRSYAARQVRDIGGEIPGCLLNNNSVTHVRTSFFQTGLFQHAVQRARSKFIT